MNAGDLRQVVSIQVNTSTPAGDSWTELRKQWARIEPVGANKLQFLSAQNSKVTHNITFREKPEVTAQMRIVWDGRIYRITAVQRFIGDRQEVTAELLQ
jgi:SPP1 family predicted phage head-tail adaptor